MLTLTNPSTSSGSSGESGDYDLYRSTIVSDVGDAAKTDEKLPDTASKDGSNWSKKKKKQLSFETNPIVWGRERKRLLRKLMSIVDEYAIRVGQQAVFLVAVPEDPVTGYTVFGTKPLENVIKNLEGYVMEPLQKAMNQSLQTPQSIPDPGLFHLPRLVVDDILTPIEMMTQAQLRSFIPVMLRYSTNRPTPKWGKESTRPPWWPVEVPWENIRVDKRTNVHKKMVGAVDHHQATSWTQALRQVVIECYRYHGREDLLQEPIKGRNFIDVDEVMSDDNMELTPTVLHTVANADGTVSIVQVDPGLDATQLSHLDGMSMLPIGEESSLFADFQEVIDPNGDVEPTWNSDEHDMDIEDHIILINEDGSESNLMSVPDSPTAFAYFE